MGVITAIAIGVVISATIDFVRKIPKSKAAHQQTIDNEIVAIQKQIEAIENNHSMVDPLANARKELENFAKNRRVTKKDLLARIEIYDDETKITLINEILNDKNQKTILGERFWRKEGFLACQPSAGALCTLGIMLRNLQENNSIACSQSNVLGLSK